jgi:PTS system ascorbate-specific IIA component
MTVGVLLITHSGLGSALLRIATGIYGICPAAAETLEVENDSPCGPLLDEAERLARRLDRGDGVLVLTDLYGSTPANLAKSLTERYGRARAVSGVNLPMLVRALNYAELDLDQLVEKALLGGRAGVMPCGPGTLGD